MGLKGVFLKHMEQEFLRVKEALKLYSISRSTLYNWFKKGLKFYKNGGVVFLKKIEIENFITKNNEF